MIERLVVLGAVVALGFLVVAWMERRPAARSWVARLRRSGRLVPGVTVAIGRDCKLCAAAVSAIRSADPGVPVRVLDASRLGGATVRSIPTVLVVDQAGEVVMRRSGRAAVTDAEAIVGAARVGLSGSRWEVA